MSESIDFKPESAAKPDIVADKRTIAQVEKWMNMICEMSREEKEETKLPA
jgi:hypothetical protein